LNRAKKSKCPTLEITQVHRWASLFRKLAFKVLKAKKFVKSASDKNLAL